ncbi:MAG: DNA polymerase III subunit alpha [Candidatus Krumholzibacteriota bacterium]|nr:DNA polymerase III subunit alpha [Candidatus Krumholzibacteriota bacterium]
MVPLLTRSHHSLMWGTAAPELLCRAARRRGYRALALTDTDNLQGLWTFLDACADEGLRPLVGAEVTDPATGERAACLVTGGAGWPNLCRLLGRRHLDAGFSLERDLPEHAAGLAVLAGSVSLLRAWKERVGDLTAALPRRPARRATALWREALRLGLPAAVVPASFFLDPEDWELHRVLRAIDRNTALSRLAHGDTAPAEAWLASPIEYARRFAIWPEALAATEALAERVAFDGPPRELVMPPWRGGGAAPGGAATDSETAGDGAAAAGGGSDAAVVLRAAAYEGARRLYGDDLPETIVERLEHELAVIARMDYASYFLVVRDIVRRSPRICGRGSGAASLVARCLGITNVCPVRHGLLFERFLNPGRRDPPDIDVDFAWDERDAVIESVLAEHAGHAAMVCNHVRFQPRMAVRETARVFGLMDREIGQVTRRLPWFWRLADGEGDFLARLRALPELRDLDFPEPWPRILALAQRLIGVPRHLSVHPGGIVITPRPIAEHAPVQRAPKGVPILQWEKDGAEAAGLVKIDLLGNRSLGVIRDALAQARAHGAPVDEARWEPEDDPATRATLAAGRTMGCFYVESPAMRLLQRKTGAGDYPHVVIHTSIIRPAANAYIREYVRRLKGGAWEPVHPLLADVLDETYGIMVYQEDVSKVATAMAGFSAAEADGLRRILTKKDRARRIGDYRARFTAGARRRGVDDAAIETVWGMMMSFDGYSFCKPHSASFARVAFQAVWLKTHRPAEFMAAVISNQGGFYATAAYVSEARRLGLAVLPPDVQSSQDAWTGRGRELRVGLMAVSGLGAATRERVVAARAAGPYRGLEDLLDRARPDREEARALILAGACDGLGADRAALLWRLERWRRRRGAAAPGEQAELFGAARAAADAPVFPPGSERERLRQQFAVLGFLCDRHPMSLHRPALAGRGLARTGDLPRLVGRRVRMAGWLVTGKVVHTRAGDPMEFLTFEDEDGLVEATFFPDAYRRFCAVLDRGRPYVLEGIVEEDFGAITLTVDGVTRLA